MAFPDNPYVSLEDPDERLMTTQDPRSFLRRFPSGAILDEAQREPALFFFWRDNAGLEVDVLQESAGRLHPVEIKSGATFTPDWLTGLPKWSALTGGEAAPSRLIYGGDTSFTFEKTAVVSWNELTV